MTAVIPGFQCPECGEESLTYNGNYYCLNMDWFMDPEVVTRRQPTWELELMVAYMQANQKDNEWAIYIDPLVAELTRRKNSSE